MPTVSMRYGKRGTRADGSPGDSTQQPGRIPSLRWTNPNPAVSFAAQTVSADLSDAEFAIIECYYTNNTTQTVSMLIKVGETGRLFSGSSDTNRNAVRPATVSAAGVDFGACQYNNATTNTALIPIRVWGW